MKLVSKLSIATGVIALATVPLAYAVDVTQFYITPTNSSGWGAYIEGMGTTSYVDDAPAADLGAASLELKTTNSFYDKIGLSEWIDMPLSNLTQASYWAKQGLVSDGNQTANLQLDVDLDGADGVVETFLTYKPNLQVEFMGIEPETWQLWDATNGQFTSSKDVGSLSSDGTSYNLDQIKQMYPNARLRAVTVFIGPDLPNSSVRIDGITVGSNMYDIEKVTPSTPGVVDVPKTVQDCKKYGWESLFTSQGDKFKNQGQCVSYIVSAKAKAR